MYLYTWLVINMDTFSQDARLLEITSINNLPIGIIYNQSIKTIGQIIDILKSKIAYSVAGLQLDDFYSKLYFCDKQTNCKLTPDTKLEDTCGKLYMSLSKTEYVFDKGYFEELKANEFPKYFNTPNSIEVYIKTLVGRITTLRVEPATPVELLKYKIYDVDGIPIDQQRLIYSGYQLENNSTLADYQVTNYSTINIVLRLRGGMLHEVSGRDGYAKLAKLILYDAIENKFIDC